MPTYPELAKKYPYIVAWGRSLQSNDYYIENQCQKAFEDNAPTDAVYFDDFSNKWITVKDCHPKTQKELETIVNNK